MFDVNLLNFNQKQAVQAPLGPVMVVAGAGTGKTRVLTSRIMYLINQKIFNPNNILALTFTNKASNEMKNRIINDGHENLKWVGTYSSICLRILKEEIGYLNRGQNFTVIDEEDQLALLKEIIKNNHIATKILPKKIQTVISNFKTNQYDEIENLSFDKFRAFDIYQTEDIKDIKKIFSMYRSRLLENNIVDFDDLLLLTLAIFDNHQNVAEKWQNKFKYILVDEFQDTNKIQFDILIHLINKREQNVFVVGDPDQTIYTWRGAYSEIFADFLNNFPNTKKYILDLNYRSSQKILDASNKLIKNNCNRIDKQLVTEKKEGEFVYLYKGESSEDEANFIAKEINKITNKYQYKEIAILYRSNYLSRNIETSLINYNIPYIIYGGVKFYQRKEIKDIVAYLKLIVNEKDELSLKRIINVPKRNIGQTTIDNINLYAMQNNLTFFEALNESYTSTDLPWNKSKIIYFLNELKKIKQLCVNLNVFDTINKIIEMTKYYDYLKEIDLNFEQREENIKELLNSIKKFGNENELFTIKDYLDKISLYTTASEEETKIDSVSLMTIHGAKGLEFSVVFLIGLNEGVFPKTISDNIEEERRIAYVGMTRAKHILYLTNARGYDYISHGNMSDSRFVKESHGAHIKEVFNQTITISDLQHEWFDTQQIKKVEDNYHAELPNINIGDQIVHVVFGEGLVISKNDNMLEVLFKSPHNKKTLNALHKSIKRKL